MTARSHSRTRANIKRRVSTRRAVARAKWERLHPDAAALLRAEAMAPRVREAADR